MAVLTAQLAPENDSLALDLTTAAAAGGDSVVHHAENFLIVENSHVSEVRTVTIANQKTQWGLAASAFNLAVTVAAGAIQVIPIGHDRFKDSNGSVQISYSDAAADLSVAVMRRSS